METIFLSKETEKKLEGDIAVKWVKQELKNTKFNAPHPLTTAVAVFFGGDLKVIAVLEAHTVKNFIGSYGAPDKYLFATFDSNEFVIGGKSEFLKR